MPTGRPDRRGDDEYFGSLCPALALGPPLMTGPNFKESYEGACDTFSALATDEDIVNDTPDTIGVHAATVPPMPHSSKSRPACDNRRPCNFQRAVMEYAKRRSNPLSKDGKPMGD
jgi:hypothetical protein